MLEMEGWVDNAWYRLGMATTISSIVATLIQMDSKFGLGALLKAF